MSVDVPDSPVRGMVRVADYTKLAEENAALRERLAYLETYRDRRVGGTVDASHGTGREHLRREPHPATRIGKLLAVIRAAPEAMCTRAIAEAAGESCIGTVAVRLQELCERGYIDRIRITNKRMAWRAKPASQPKE